MSDKKIKWTKSQQAAIEHTGSDILVTASAGTGKTAVLSSRCARICSDSKICPSVCNMLVLTFTEAAAEQMSGRIRGQLQAKAQSEPGNRHIQNQLILLPGADISTIDSFCKRLITEYFYRLDIDPAFRVMDEDEQRLVKADAVEKTFEWAWEQEHLRGMLEKLFYSRDVSLTGGFASEIIRVSEFVNTFAMPDDWFDRALALSELQDPYGGGLGERQKEIVARQLGFVLKRLEFAGRLYASNNAAVSAKHSEIYEQVNQCVELLNRDDWQGVQDIVLEFSKPTVTKSKDVEAAIAEMIAKLEKDSCNDFAALKDYAVFSPEYLNIVSDSAGLQIKVFVELVRAFERFYSQAKRRLNSLDFSDMERLALRLLTVVEDGELVASETALKLREKYKYIFVDEYQDTNPVQEAIVQAIGSGDNVFVVGDVKQSIYAFRGAEPGIFLGRLEPATDDPTDKSRALRINLNDNFRSDKAVLDFINRLFCRVMTKSFAGIDYKNQAQLKAGSVSENDEKKVAVELHVVDKDDAKNVQSEQSTSARDYQAALIAMRIKQMVGSDSGQAEFKIFDKEVGEYRPVQYGDIAILMRSPAGRANDYVRILRQFGIPVSTNIAGGFFEAVEVRDIISVLKVIDNSQRDIELAAVLRSSFFDVSDDELAKIRLGRSDAQCSDFYSSVTEYVRQGGDDGLREKLSKAMEQLHGWREVGNEQTVADLIWQIYRTNGYLSFVSGLSGGNLRRANLLKLHEKAIAFEGFANDIVSVGKFVEFIEKIEQNGGDWKSAEPDNAAGDCVQIISVHRSKGLEYPVVVLAELNSKFNAKDSASDVLSDPLVTLGLQVIDSESSTKLSSLTHQIIANKKKQTMLAEEMRILYVALTRARDRLVLVGGESGKRCREMVLNGGFTAEDELEDWQLNECGSFLDWILCGLGNSNKIADVFETGSQDEIADENLFDFNFYDSDKLGELSGYLSKAMGRQTRDAENKSGGNDKQLLAKIKANLGYKYAYSDISLLPAKRTVTQLTHSTDEFASRAAEASFVRLPAAVSVKGKGGSIDSRAIGIATHLVMAELDLFGQLNDVGIRSVIARLCDESKLDEAMVNAIDVESIVRFFDSEPGRVVLANKDSVLREWAFTCAMGAWQVFDELQQAGKLKDAKDEKIIVQGVIDMLVATDDGIVIVDFKTDNVFGEKLEQRASIYAEQVRLYGYAAEAILKKEVAGKWLYFLKEGRSIEI